MVGGLNERFRFDPDSHTYTYDGVVYPGVTTLIKSLIDYSMVGEEMLRIAAERGSAVHLATALDDERNLDEDSMDRQLVPYLDAWRKFLHEYGFEPEAIERPLFHSAHRYCCTLDRTGRMRRRDAHYRLVEIKTTSQLLPATGVQLIGQKLAWEANGGERITARGAVQLRADGTYRYREYDDPDDLPTFMAQLTTNRWLKKYDPRRAAA